MKRQKEINVCKRQFLITSFMINTYIFLCLRFGWKEHALFIWYCILHVSSSSSLLMILWRSLVSVVFIFNLKFLPTVSIIFRTDVLNSPLLLVCWFLCHSVICCISDFVVVLFDAYMVVRDIPFYSIVPYTNIQLIKHPSLLLMTLFSLNSFFIRYCILYLCFLLVFNWLIFFHPFIFELHVSFFPSVSYK